MEEFNPFVNGLRLFLIPGNYPKFVQEYLDQEQHESLLTDDFLNNEEDNNGV